MCGYGLLLYNRREKCVNFDVLQLETARRRASSYALLLRVTTPALRFKSDNLYVSVLLFLPLIRYVKL